MKLNRTLAVILVFFAQFALAKEAHVDGVVGEVLASVAKLKKADPSAVPMAFWDFDGTIIKGDLSVGLTENGRECYKGLIEECILSGFSATHKGEAGWLRFRDVEYPALHKFGRYMAWPYCAQMFEGASVAEIDAFCQRKVQDVYRKWYFTSSVEILKRLEAAGVENHIVSGSPQIFVEGTAKSLGLARSRIHSLRVRTDGGYVTTQIEYPLPSGEGKVDIVRSIVNGRRNAYAIAAFGNSYKTDAAFMRYVVSQRNLPGGATGFAMMINGFEPLPGFENLFRCVTQSEVAW